MKRLILAISLILTTLLSCVKEQTEPNILNVSQPRLTIPVEGASPSVSVTCDFTWSASLKSGSWLKITKTDTQSESPSVTLSAGFSTEFDIRTDTLLIKSGSRTLSVPVSQDGLGTIVSSSNIVIRNNGNVVAFVVTSPCDWTAESTDTKSSPVWFDFNPKSGKTGSTMVKVSALEDNMNVGDRNAFIRMNMGGNRFCVTVTQKQKDAILLSADKVELKNRQSEFELLCSTNVDCKVEIDPGSSSWLSLVSTKSLNERTMVFKALANGGDESRSGTITVSGNGLAEKVSVYQAERDMLIFEKSALELGDKGGETSIGLKSNVEFSVSVDDSPDWIHAYVPNKTRIDKVIIKVEPNVTYSDRTAVVRVKDINSDLTQTLAVRQVQNDAVILDEPEKTVSNKGGVFAVKLKSNVDYDVRIPDEGKIWLSTVQTKGLSVSEIAFEAKPNLTDEVRWTEVLIFSSTASDTLRFTQLERDRIIVTPQEYAAEFCGGVMTVAVKSNVEYEVTHSSDWLAREPSNSVDKLSFRLSQNLTGADRTAEIYFKGTSSEASDTLKLIQFRRPEGTFLDSDVPGAYGVQGRDWTYSRQNSQLSVWSDGSQYCYRLFFPYSSKMFELKCNSADLQPGDRVRMRRSIYSVPDISSVEEEILVMQKRDGLMWLSSASGEKFIIKQLD